MIDIIATSKFYTAYTRRKRYSSYFFSSLSDLHYCFLQADKLHCNFTNSEMQDLSKLLVKLFKSILL